MRKYDASDLTGRRIGRLKVLKRDGSRRGHSIWLCKCDCGTQKYLTGSALRQKQSQSCGCLYRERIHDLTGKRFGRLQVLGFAGHIGKYRSWYAKCDCGKVIERRGAVLIHGNTTSCGCGTLHRIKSDLIGKKFGRVTVLELINDREDGQLGDLRVWRCKCECGKILEKTTRQLRSECPSCGKHATPNIEKRLVGKRFGKLTVIRFIGTRIWGNKKALRHWRKWSCICDCGKETTATTWMLTSGNKKSCGCLERGNFKHGLSQGRMYRKWVYLKRHAKKLGLPFSKRWKEFSNFMQDVPDYPEKHHAALKVRELGFVPDNLYWEPFKYNYSRKKPDGIR